VKAKTTIAGPGEPSYSVHEGVGGREAGLSDAARWRLWTTADGKYTVYAKFVKFAFGTATLEKQDGTTVDVELDILCSEDQEFVRRRKWMKNAHTGQ
jgi:hypothetical protein